MKKLNLALAGTTAFVALMIGSTVLGNRQPVSTPQAAEQVKSATTEVPVKNGYVEHNGTYDCTSDCSGHEAGYEWADKYQICDPEYDNGNSDSFNEGVMAWGRDNCLANDDQL